MAALVRVGKLKKRGECYRRGLDPFNHQRVKGQPQ